MRIIFDDFEKSQMEHKQSFLRDLLVIICDDLHMFTPMETVYEMNIPSIFDRWQSDSTLSVLHRKRILEKVPDHFKKIHFRGFYFNGILFIENPDIDEGLIQSAHGIKRTPIEGTPIKVIRDLFTLDGTLKFQTDKRPDIGSQIVCPTNFTRGIVINTEEEEGGFSVTAKSVDDSKWIVPKKGKIYTMIPPKYKIND